MRHYGISLLLVILFSIPLSAQNKQDGREQYIEMGYEIDWQEGSFQALIRYDVRKSGLRLPGARALAEEMTRLAFPGFLQEAILDMRVDSSTGIGDLLSQNSLQVSELMRFASSAKQEGSKMLLEEGILESRYTIDLRAALPLLVRHQSITRPPRALRAGSSRAYTGIIIFVDEELPVHGTRRRALARPCFFPRIHDEQMNLIYERHMVDPLVASTQGIVRYTQRAASDTWSELAGDDPMVILASGLFGVDATDPVISAEDALRILSNPSNRSLLERGKLVLVVHPSVRFEEGSSNKPE